MSNSDSPTYTVREIARKITVEDRKEEFKRRLRQVRHWTNSGLLKPTGQKHPGTGVARTYGPDEVRKAALLRELTRFGMSINIVDPDADGIEYHTKQEPWKKAIKGKSEVYLELLYRPDDGLGWNIMDRDKSSMLSYLDTDNTKPYMKEYVSALVINLTKLFKSLEL